MPFWDREPFPALLEEGRFSFADPGPLLAPIKTFKLYRNDKLQLALETLGGKETVATYHMREADPNWYETKQDAVIKSIMGKAVNLKGVQPESVQMTSSHRGDVYESHESARVFTIEGDLKHTTEAVYTIDWLENVRNYYLWPQMVLDDEDTVFTRAYGREADTLVLTDKDGRHASGRSAIKLTLGGIELYLTKNSAKEGARQIKPGYILYKGLPGEDTRRKIRTVLSYTLGIYFVYLGYSTYTRDWTLSSFRAVTPYSMDMRAFDIHVQPPAFIGVRAHNELDTTKVSRLVSGLYQHYEELDFGNLSWGFWHAMTAPLHIKAVHFGAIIEALQRNYLMAHPKEFSERVVIDSNQWGKLKTSVAAAINAEALTDPQKTLLRDNVGRLNQTPRATLTDQVLDHLGVVLGDDEKRAWQRRHDAAHGAPMTPGKEREVIRDTHLLRVIFNRMVLSIVNGNDHYYNYAAKPSPDFPIRALRDPVPSV